MMINVKALNKLLNYYYYSWHKGDARAPTAKFKLVLEIQTYDQKNLLI